MIPNFRVVAGQPFLPHARWPDSHFQLQSGHQRNDSWIAIPVVAGQPQLIIFDGWTATRQNVFISREILAQEIVDMPPKGGARRLPTPQIDMEHLQDVLKDQVKTLGVSEAFQFGEYLGIQKSQAINGKALVAMGQFVYKLLAVNELLLFNYRDLKEGFAQVLRDFPEVKQSFPVEMRSVLSGKLAEACMTMCTHLRRLKVEQKFTEACRHLSDWQVKKLQELRAAVVHEKAKPQAAPACSEEEKVSVACSEEEKVSVATEELLARDLPKTPAGKETALLEAALNESPVPARKQNLRKMHPLKKPSAKAEKKPATSVKKTVVKDSAKKDKSSLNYKNESLHLMTYKSTTAVAVRAKNVGQLFQVVKYKDLQKNTMAAQKLMTMLKKTGDLKAVLKEKAKL